jgi:hypothetical protein
MDSQTRLDKALTWIKNNKVSSVVMLVAIAVVGTSQLVSSLTSLAANVTAFLNSSGQEHAATAAAETVSVEKKEAAPGAFATATLTFGDKGTGPGFFSDARHIAIDKRGTLFICEFDNHGRVQRFDPGGKFLSQWFAGDVNNKDDFSVSEITIDEHGMFYMAHSQGAFRYEADSGKPMGTAAIPPSVGVFSLDSVQPNPTGGIVMWASSTDDHSYLILVNSQGEVRRTIRDPLTAHLEARERLDWPHVAVDGLGNIYLIATYGHAVFKMSPDGEYLNRFGSEGESPGQFQSTSAIAIDGKGDVYVADGVRIQKFDSGGTYLGLVRVGYPVDGMVFNGAGELYAVSDHTVVKFELTGKERAN